MGSSVNADFLRDRLSGRELPQGIGAAVAIVAALLALALAAGGYSEVALGAATALVWLLVAVTALVRPDALRATPSPLALAALFLVALLAFTALSLGWGSDDGAGFIEVVRLAGYLGVFLLVGLIAAPGRGPVILAALATGIVAVSLIALASRLGGIGGGDAELADLLPPASGRLSYPLGYWNALGALMALAVPVLVSSASRPRRSRLTGISLAAMTPVLLTAYMTSSRGALLAALLGASAAIGFAADRRRAAAALVVGIAGALPTMVAATLFEGILDGPGDGTPGVAELTVAGLAIAGVASAFAFGDTLVTRLAKLRRFRLPARRAVLVPVALVLVVGGVLLTGPGRLVDDFSTLQEDARTDTGTGIVSASGSGRAQFWGTALDGFADAPLKGIGAGGYANYWNRNGTLGTPTKNAHSEPLELLAELGIVGFACFIGFAGVVAVAGVRRARSPAAGWEGGAALGALVAGSVGLAIDWTWQVPVVAASILAVAACVCGRAFAPRGEPEAEIVRDGQWRAFAPSRVPAPLLACGLIALAAASVWAGGVLAIASSQLDQSESALADGDASRAAQAARTAISVEPWAAEPWLQLAEIERSVDNVEAAQRAAVAAIDRGPDDFRAWLLASALEGQLGNVGASVNYAVRAVALAPRIVLRIGEFVSPVPRGGT